MNVHWFIFIVLLAMCVVLGVAFRVPQVPYENVVQKDGSTQRIIKSHGYEHEQYPTMECGGPGAERHAVTFWVGWVFSMLCVLFFTGCLWLGAARHGKLGPAKAPLIFGTVAFAAIFTALFNSYYAYMHEETHSLFLSFVKPTAWTLFGVWTFPVFFMVLYYRFFDQWHFTKEDEKRLEEITARSQQVPAERH